MLALVQLQEHIFRLQVLQLAGRTLRSKGLLVTGIFAAEFQQARRLVLQQCFHLLPQVRTWRIQSHTAFQKGLGHSRLHLGQGRQQWLQLRQGQAAVFRQAQHINAAGHAWRLHLLQDASLHFQQTNLMSVLGFRHGQGQGRAAVAHALSPSHRLRLVQMPQCHIAQVIGKDICWQGMLVAAQDLPFTQIRELGAHHEAMPHGQQSLLGLQLLTGILQHLLVDLTHAFDEVILLSQIQISGTQEGHRSTVRRHAAIRIIEWNHQPLWIQATLGVPQGAQHMHALVMQELLGRLQAQAGVVVAGNGHDLQFGLLALGRRQEIKPHAYRRRGGVGHIKNIAGNQQHIHTGALQGGQQPLQELRMLRLPRNAMQAVSQVPVGSVQDTHGDDGSGEVQENRMATVFITGATGFVGATLLPMLHAQGHQLRCLLRPGNPGENLVGIPHERIVGDLANSEALAEGLAGCDLVVHLAALVSFSKPDRQRMFQINAQGTAVLARLAREAGVQRFLHMSSVAAVGGCRNPQVLDENSPYTLHKYDLPYFHTKLAAEQAVLEEVQRGLDAVVVNPSSMFGPGDRRKAEGSLLDAAQKGRIPFAPPGGVNVADVRDVARGCLQALESGRRGQRYILGGENLHGRELVETILAQAGQPAPRFGLPAVLLRGLAVGARLVETVHPLRPPMTAQMLTMAPMYFWYSSAKAERELGYHHGPVAPAIQEAYAWMRTQAQK